MSAPMIEIRDPEGDREAFYQALLGFHDAHAAELGHPYARHEYGIAAMDGDTFMGGLEYELIFDWCFVALLAVHPEGRGKGIGAQLMRALEARMRAEPCIGIWLDTRGFQAAPFYAKLGYEEFGRLPGRVPAKDKIFMRKFLGDTP